ncbi:LpqB family beta-propeller domain-containing protein [Herbidospora mongoliensis]|uniref:LpqB family beta-propeller domain-containing protein n=1 Tax=Herbidospora mongoliensis TaxID=688067 RepID=UPI0012F73CD4|nr:LpqB family beta-propeller domain-containing protein [Herbidospora mongoliensis]
MSTRRVFAMVATAAALAGCTIVPTSGNPPTASEEERGGDILSQTYVRILAQPPRPDATAVEIVRGFQAAMASFDDPQRKVARQYLTGEAATGWQPWATATTVCDCRFADDLPEEDADKFSVSFKGKKVATLEKGGRYRPTSSEETVDESFTLIRVNGEWRISAAPAGLILLRSDLTRAYAPVEIYFPNLSFTGLVADRVRVPIDPSRGLPESLIRTLLNGPSGPLAGAVENVYPEGTKLNGIRVEGDTLYVDFSAQIAGLRGRPDRIKAMQAQLAWSLGTDRIGGRSIEILVNGETFPGGGIRFKITDFPSYDPAVITGDVAGYFVRDGMMYRAAKDGEQSAPVLGAAGQSTRPFNHSAVSSEDRDQVAALMGDETGVWATQLVDGSPWQRWINAQGRLTPPSWDRNGEVWSVESAGGRSQVWRASTGGHQSPVPAPELAEADVTAFRVARDGVRVAVVADNGSGQTVQIGSIVRGQTYRVGALETLVPAEEGQKVIDVAWKDATTLLVLTEKDSPNGPQQALAAYPILDGDEKTPIELSKRLKSITSTDSRILASDENGALTVWDGKKWNLLVKDGSSFPAYPLG